MPKHPLLATLMLAFSCSFPAKAELPAYHMQHGDRAKQLEFPSEVSDIEFESAPRMALFKPDGAGPFPALTLLHQCGGLRNNTSMLNWAKEGVNRGYVVLLLDSLGQRDVAQVCSGPKNDVYFSTGLRDAVRAAAHLRQLPFVDKSRVAFAGFSWGGATGLQASSSKSADALNLQDRYDALVSVYPPCNAYPKNGSPPYTLIVPTTDRPLLVLLGGKDTETPAEECIAGLQPQKAAGAPVDWHLYPEATHCWDCIQHNGLKKTDHFRGVEVEYIYNATVTRDSAERIFGFLAKSLKR
jgi:dienelactone hydrolase